MSATDAHTDVDADARSRHGWWAGFFIAAALLVLLVSAGYLGDGRIVVVGVFAALLSIGLVFLGAELRRPPPEGDWPTPAAPPPAAMLARHRDGCWSAGGQCSPASGAVVVVRITL